MRHMVVILFMLLTCSSSGDRALDPGIDSAQPDLTDSGAADASDPGQADTLEPGPADIPEADSFLPPNEDPSVGDVSGIQVILHRGPPPVAEVRFQGKALARSRPGFVSFGAVPGLEPNAYVDPYDPAFDIAWLPLQRISGAAKTALGWRLVLDYGDSRLAVADLEALAPDRVRFHIAPVSRTDEWVIRVAMGIDDTTVTEQFYGLGEYFDTPAHRGKRRAMQFEIAPGESGYNEAHVPIPLLVSTRGWGLFVESRRPGAWDVAATDPAEVRADFETAEETVWFFAGNRPIDVLKPYVEVTGKPLVPATWAFGPIFWRNENKDQAEVLEDAQAIRANDLAGSGLWIDNPWQTAYNSFVFRPDRFPDAKQMVADLNDLGFRVAVWSTPYLEEAAGDDYTKALENGWFVGLPGGSWFDKFGRLVDLTNPDAETFWKTLIGRVSAIGIEGYKLDYGEDIQIGMLGLSLDFTFFNGLSAHEMHHGYALDYHRPYAAMLPPDGGFVLSRAGTYGDQIYTTTIWPGDLDSDFHEHREDGFVGGLPAAVSGGLSLATSGYPFFASDTGGFRNGRPTQEVFLRWTEYAAFGPIMQIGGGGENHNPWDFKKYGDSQFDAETLDVFRKYANLHLRLFPYFYSLAREAAVNGRCITCPVGFVYPETGRHPPADFLVGDSLFVAPVVKESTKRIAAVPPGRWHAWRSAGTSTGWLDGWEAAEGPADKTFDVPLEETVVLLKAGAIVPLLDPSIRTLGPVKDPAAIRSFAANPGRLFGLAVPADAGESSFAVWDGSKLAMKRTAEGFVLSFAQGTTFTHGLRWLLALRALTDGAIPGPLTVTAKDGKPIPAVGTSQELDACASCVFQDPATGVASIQVPAGDHEIVVNWKK